MSQAYASTNSKMQGGGVFTAPKGTTLPTEEAIKTYITGSGADDAKTLVPAGFVYTGDISEDGMTTTEETDSESFVDIDGVEVLNARTTRSESCALSFIDIDVQGLKETYGEDNVVEADGVITVKHNGTEPAERVALVLILLADGRRMVRAIPRYKRTEVGDETIAVSELLTREVTWAMLPDASGNTAYDYITPPDGESPYPDNMPAAEGTDE